MAFWNKSDDPWDREPGKQSAPVYTQPEEQTGDASLTDKARAYFGITKKDPEVPPAPIPCPWCGKETRMGYISSGNHQGVFWAPGVPGHMKKWGLGGMKDAWSVATLGELFFYQTAWYCEDCRKLIVDIPAPDPEWQARLERTMETHPQTAEETDG